MDPIKLKALLQQVADGNLSPDEAVKGLRGLPFEDLGFAKLDHHRALRNGMPETIYCAGKTPEQVVSIAQRMKDHGSNVLGTRCDTAIQEAVRAAHSDAVIHESARCFTIYVEEPPKLPGFVAVVCAGTSDMPVGEEAIITLESMGIPVERIYDVGVAGIHRLLAVRSKIEEATCVVVCAGMEGALPSAVGGLVDRPVIAVPTSIGYGASFGGIAALLGMLNSCAAGVSVVNIDNGFGAGVLAAMIHRLAHGAAAQQPLEAKK